MDKINDNSNKNLFEEDNKEILFKYETIITAMEELQKVIPHKRKELEKNIEEKICFGLSEINNQKIIIIKEINNTRKENEDKFRLKEEEIIDKISNAITNDFDAKFDKINDSIKLLEKKITEATKIKGVAETSNVSKTVKTATKKQVVKSTSLLDMIKDNGIEYVDKRSKPGGNLWIIGGQEELKPFVDECKALLGASFTFCPNGGLATHRQQSWFTTFKD